jgi:hypothetical protein
MNHLISQIDISVERGQKRKPDKVSKSGNFSTFEKFSDNMEQFTHQLFTSTESYMTEGAKNQESV